MRLFLTLTASNFQYVLLQRITAISPFLIASLFSVCIVLLGQGTPEAIASAKTKPDQHATTLRSRARQSMFNVMEELKTYSQPNVNGRRFCQVAFMTCEHNFEKVGIRFEWSVHITYTVLCRCGTTAAPLQEQSFRGLYDLTPLQSTNQFLLKGTQ